MLDKAMRKGFGWGLSRLRPEKAPRPLALGEAHFEVAAADLPEEAGKGQSCSCLVHQSMFLLPTRLTHCSRS